MQGILEYRDYKLILDFNIEDLTLGADTIIEAFNIYESMQSIPYFEMLLVNKDINSFSNLKNINFKYLSDNLSYESVLGVNSIQEINGGILINGWMTNQENFREVRTRYLGNNVKTALNRLNIRKKINLDDNPNIKIFQINQTNLVQALTVCSLATQTPFWNIGRYSINLKDNKEIIETDLPFKSSVQIIPSNNYELTMQSTNWISALSSKNYYQISNLDDSNSINNRLNYLQMIRSGIKYMTTGFYSGEYPSPVGTRMKNTNAYYNEVTNWIVASCYYHYIAKGVETDIQYFGLMDQIK